ncbi:MAG TPA: MFS transporter [Cyclobacteriaceae bacterium]|nr:MFS transporter [Cyclobacteriaceae bacterium]
MNPDYNKKLVFAAACLAVFLFGVVMLSLGTIMPFITAKYGLDEYSKGILATVLPFGILAGSILFGPVADRYGYRYLILIGVFIFMCAYLLIARTSSVLTLSLVFFFIGFSGGILNGSANALVSGVSEDFNENKAANLSLMGVFFGIGALGMPFILAMLTRLIPFEKMITGAGFLMILPLIYFYHIRYPASRSAKSVSIKAWFRLAATPLMFLTGMIGFFQSGLESLVNNWITSYLIGTAAVTEKKALFALTLFVGVFTFSRLLLGVIFRKVGQGLVISVSMPLVFSGVIILMVPGGNDYYLVSLVLFGLGLAATFPVITGYAGDLFKDLPGTAIGILFTLSLIGNMGINYLTGFITGKFGYNAYPVIFAAVVLLMSLIFLLFYRKYNASKIS